METCKIYCTALILGLIASCTFIKVRSAYTHDTTKAKVLDLQQQTIISGSKTISTDIRYLVICENETFVCDKSLLNQHFNASDIFFRLKKDSTYTFKVAGLGKGFITDYRNILSFSK